MRLLPWLILESQHALVFDKPAGWAVSVQEGRDSEFGDNVDVHYPHWSVPFQNWLAAFVARYRPEIRLSPDVFNIVIRKDRATTGPVVVAKRPEDVMPMRLALSDKTGDALKVYRCIVHGHPRDPRGNIEASILCEETRRAGVEASFQTCRANAPGGLSALSKYVVESTFAGAATGQPYSLVSVRIFTGRTHQVRLHMAHIGHALAGDAAYQTPDQARAAAADGFRGFLLHNSRLRFEFKGEVVDIGGGLPPAFVAALRDNLVTR